MRFDFLLLFDSFTYFSGDGGVAYIAIGATSHLNSMSDRVRLLRRHQQLVTWQEIFVSGLNWR